MKKVVFKKRYLLTVKATDGHLWSLDWDTVVGRFAVSAMEYADDGFLKTKPYIHELLNRLEDLPASDALWDTGQAPRLLRDTVSAYCIESKAVKIRGTRPTKGMKNALGKILFKNFRRSMRTHELSAEEWQASGNQFLARQGDLTVATREHFHALLKDILLEKALPNTMKL